MDTVITKTDENIRSFNDDSVAPWDFLKRSELKHCNAEVDVANRSFVSFIHGIKLNSVTTMSQKWANNRKNRSETFVH